MRKLTLLFALLLLSYNAFSQISDSSSYVLADTLRQNLSVLSNEMVELENSILALKEENTALKELISDKDNEIDLLKKNIDALSENSDSLLNLYSKLENTTNTQYEMLRSNLSAMANDVDSLNKDLEKELNRTVQKIDSTKADLAGLKSKTENEFSSLTTNISSRTWWITGSIILALFLSVMGLLWLKGILSDQESTLSTKISDTNKSLETKISQIEQTNKADTKLLEILNEKLETLPEKKENAEQDHSLAIASALEITRMRKRLELMDGDVKGLKSLEKALERLEDELKIKGYEIIDLEGQPYNEGMNVEADFITDDSLKQGEEIITRVIKRQVNFNGKVIQQAKVQVSIAN
ncbi:MAG: hypothetical protein WDZ80_08060 [Candidatus Paceibacterota bacterium]